ncbi:hypothetical protein SLE2022_170480 [Rubroshorea leprosula]
MFWSLGFVKLVAFSVVSNLGDSESLVFLVLPSCKVVALIKDFWNPWWFLDKRLNFSVRDFDECCFKNG